MFFNLCIKLGCYKQLKSVIQSWPMIDSSFIKKINLSLFMMQKCDRIIWVTRQKKKNPPTPSKKKKKKRNLISQIKNFFLGEVVSF